MYIDKIQEIVNKNDEDALELLELDKNKLNKLFLIKKNGIATKKRYSYALEKRTPYKSSMEIYYQIRLYKARINGEK